MATQSGSPDSALGGPLPGEGREARAALEGVLRELEAEPGAFDFFQAVRLLLRTAGTHRAAADLMLPERSPVRFRTRQSLAFPPNDIDAVTWNQGVAQLVVGFMGLTGPSGVLPRAYTDLILSRMREKDRTLPAFFDIFNHRMISLFYQAWEKYRSWAAYERDGQDRLSKYLAAFIGLATAGLQERSAVPDAALLYYTGLLGLQPRSSSGLRQMLADYFEIPVEVEEFVGVWQRLDEDSQCLFEDGMSFSRQVGVGAVVGDAVWDQQSRIRLKLGPLTAEKDLSFLPKGSAYQPLRDLTRFYCGAELEVEAQLILKRDEVPNCEPGNDDPSGPQLGWFTWMKSGPEFDRSPSDTVLLLA